MARFSVLLGLAGLLQTSVCDAGESSCEAELVNTLKRFETIEKNATHPLMARHARSMSSLIRSEWARTETLPPESPLLPLLSQDVTAINKGLDLGNDRWQAFRDAGQPLVFTHVSKLDGTLQMYHLVLPKDWREDRSYPLYLELHGAGDRQKMRPLGWVASTLGVAPDYEKGYCPVRMRAMEVRDGFHLYPYGRGNSSYRGGGEADVWEALADVEKCFNIDPARRYLYGFSMGGSGTYYLAAERPELWAAIAIFGSSPMLSDAPDDLAPKLAEIPLFFWCGEKDPWVEGARRKAKVLQDTAKSDRHIEFAPGIEHNYLGAVQAKAHEFLQKHQSATQVKLGKQETLNETR